ncbi:hypothetical protein NEUTE1DRAFT_116953 [Neurospora tetrasperma FGSC 2508]|uniref:Uncharacterized protein n=1 Tax=Neurospora tetrasperma (strain FGSC 2508 / ATCC MYA-4615 / P0657) TaxID=510951 RepID=F8MMF1_NEUT8|nr:uncharacterized protein NEUTE1DRAFT_116953 [Neurospora tetrasperma FGSC 2508]EGO57825.1 hypothetical protein NEUTE1DRAFT_116953 [Neurospora tetrasperma FGSC 2508]EGZ71894.1 hypothetical protein NEUTE2DRAFT_144654 [Neurospora tetrasperma FGSC 2509]
MNDGRAVIWHPTATGRTHLPRNSNWFSCRLRHSVPPCTYLLTRPCFATSLPFVVRAAPSIQLNNTRHPSLALG